MGMPVLLSPASSTTKCGGSGSASVCVCLHGYCGVTLSVWLYAAPCHLSTAPLSQLPSGLSSLVTRQQLLVYRPMSGTGGRCYLAAPYQLGQTIVTNKEVKQ